MRAAAALLAALLSSAPALAVQAPLPPPRAESLALPATSTPAAAMPALAASPRTGAAPAPAPRPRLPAASSPALEAAALSASLSRAPTAAGTVCGDPRIAGTRIAPIRGPGQCGIASPVRVTAVAGVQLDPPATIACETAAALADWVGGTVAPTAQRTLGARLSALKIAASYSCRPRNNVSEA